jgi:hypothetical protein
MNELMIGYSETERWVFPFKTLIDVKIIASVEVEWRERMEQWWKDTGKRKSKQSGGKKRKISLNTTLSTVNPIRTGLVSNMYQFALGN